MILLLAFSILIRVETAIAADYLQVKGGDFVFNNSKVFLSGVNLAWNSYAYDFGNGVYQKITHKVLENWIKEISSNGGNSLRIWIHCEGQNTPEFDSNGFAISPDRDGTVIADLGKFLDVAEYHNVFVILVLWNGAVRIDGNLRKMVDNDDKLQAYINKVLKPMVAALKTKPALAAWEIMNEPEGSLKMTTDSNSCYDTMKMKPFGGGWTKSNVSMERMLRFINRQSAAIKSEDPKALVTLGSWSHVPQTDTFPETYNYYKDSCLIAAGNDSKGTIDFYQMHTYSWEGKFAQNSPFLVNATSYKLDKPLVIGEFSSSCGEGKSAVDLFSKAYTTGYDGAWSWQYNAGGHCADSKETQNKALKATLGLAKKKVCFKLDCKV